MAAGIAKAFECAFATEKAACIVIEDCDWGAQDKSGESDCATSEAFNQRMLKESMENTDCEAAEAKECTRKCTSCFTEEEDADKKDADGNNCVQGTCFQDCAGFALCAYKGMMKQPEFKGAMKAMNEQSETCNEARTTQTCKGEKCAWEKEEQNCPTGASCGHCSLTDEAETGFIKQMRKETNCKSSAAKTCKATCGTCFAHMVGGEPATPTSDGSEPEPEPEPESAPMDAKGRDCQRGGCMSECYQLIICFMPVEFNIQAEVKNLLLGAGVDAAAADTLIASLSESAGALKELVFPDGADAPDMTKLFDNPVFTAAVTGAGVDVDAAKAAAASYEYDDGSYDGSAASTAAAAAAAVAAGLIAALF